MAPESGPPPSSVESASPGGRYAVIEELASGGMGTVYRVFDRVSGQERALKRPRAGTANQRLVVEALQREYHVLATLDHPRIIRVFDYGVDDVGPYYTMELLAGSDMRKVAPLPYRQACLHIRDVATSLALLHARRLLHRDLSPGNVRMTDDGRCKLLDFGALAVFGHSEVVAGTPSVVPPEAFGHAPLDERADLYSLGALAYWILTGRHAYPAARLEDLPTQWQVNPSPPSSLVPGIPAALDALVLSLLAADPLARPASVAEVIGRLTGVGELPDESTTETKRLALSFLSNPRFIGRAAPLETARALMRAAIEGHGGAIWIEAISGMGRSRLLQEIGVRARLGSSAVVCVDASVAQHSRGTIRGLVLGVLDALPELARKHAGAFRRALGLLGPDVRKRLGIATSTSAPPESDAEVVARELEGWFVEISRERPLLVQVDNVERADGASLGLLASLASIAHEHPLVVIVAACSRSEDPPPIGVAKLRTLSVQVELAGLGPAEMSELARSLFGEAPERRPLRRVVERAHRGQSASRSRNLAAAAGEERHPLLGRRVDAAQSSAGRSGTDGPSRRALDPARARRGAGTRARGVPEPSAPRSNPRALHLAVPWRGRRSVPAPRGARGARRPPRRSGRLPLHQHGAPGRASRRDGRRPTREESPSAR